MADQDDLARFVEAQEDTYASALAEVRAGRKRSHWMWFIFPQIAGLGQTPTARFYALADLAEARAYLDDKLLGGRLIECTEAALDWAGRKSAEAIFGHVDSMKFRSSMTLFEAAGPDEDCFGQAIDGFFDGERDALTLERL